MTFIYLFISKMQIKKVKIKGKISHNQNLNNHRNTKINKYMK